MVLEISLFVGAFILIIFLCMRYGMFFKKYYQGPHQTYDLSIPNTTVLSPTDFAWSTSPCTLRFAIFVNVSPKTVATVDCINHTTESPTVFAPDCKDYSYRACKCRGTDCGDCTMDSTVAGPMSNLLSLGDYVQLWASGYTNQNDRPNVPALLKVRTGIDSNQHYMESIPLPAIPLQKWTVITIVKEGRRFDIYYGAKLQVSKMTTYPPLKPDTASQNVVVGNKRWGGYIGMFKGTASASYAKDVQLDLSTFLDTRGIPAIQLASEPIFALPPCLFGNCTGLPDVKPPNQFSVYQTNYS